MASNILGYPNEQGFQNSFGCFFLMLHHQHKIHLLLRQEEGMVWEFYYCILNQIPNINFGMEIH